MNTVAFSPIRPVTFEDLTIIVPTFNEAGALPVLLAHLAEHYPGARILVADDDSDDGTREIALAFEGPLHVDVLHRHSDTVRGLTAAVVDALKLVTTKHFIVMDADLQHPAEAVLEVYKHASNGAHLAVGRRMNYEPLTLGRRMVSRGARSITRTYLRSQQRPLVDDPMSGFFGGKTWFAREILDEHEHKFEKPGFKVLVDFLRFAPSHTKVEEVPYEFGARAAGTSKMRITHVASLLRQLGPVGRAAAATLLTLLTLEFWKFAAVGLSGVLVNQAALALLHDGVGLPLLAAGLVSIELAILWNFTWNDRWSFAGRGRRRAWTTRIARFNLHCLAGTAINLAVLHLLSTELHVHYLWANLVGIAGGTAWNWVLSKAWTWSDDESGPATDRA